MIVDSGHLMEDRTLPVCGQVSDEVLDCLRKIIQSIDLHSRFLSKRFGLTGPQLVILREITRRNGITAGEVARAISLSQATVTGILERLERGGFIARRRSDADRRRILLQTTEAASTVLAEAPPVLQESFVSAFNNLPGWEQLMILSALRRLVVLMNLGQGTDPSEPL